MVSLWPAAISVDRHPAYLDRQKMFGNVLEISVRMIFFLSTAMDTPFSEGLLLRGSQQVAASCHRFQEVCMQIEEPDSGSST